MVLEMPSAVGFKPIDLPVVQLKRQPTLEESMRARKAEDVEMALNQSRLDLYKAQAEDERAKARKEAGRQEELSRIAQSVAQKYASEPETLTKKIKVLTELGTIFNENGHMPESKQVFDIANKLRDDKMAVAKNVLEAISIGVMSKDKLTPDLNETMEFAYGKGWDAQRKPENMTEIQRYIQASPEDQQKYREAWTARGASIQQPPSQVLYAPQMLDYARQNALINASIPSNQQQTESQVGDILLSLKQKGIVNPDNTVSKEKQSEYFGALQEQRSLTPELVGLVDSKVTMATQKSSRDTSQEKQSRQEAFSTAINNAMRPEDLINVIPENEAQRKVLDLRRSNLIQAEISKNNMNQKEAWAYAIKNNAPDKLSKLYQENAQIKLPKTEESKVYENNRTIATAMDLLSDEEGWNELGKFNNYSSDLEKAFSDKQSALGKLKQKADRFLLIERAKISGKSLTGNEKVAWENFVKNEGIINPAYLRSAIQIIADQAKIERDTTLQGALFKPEESMKNKQTPQTNLSNMAGPLPNQLNEDTIQLRPGITIRRKKQ